MKTLRIKTTITSSLRLEELKAFIGKEVEIVIKEKASANADKVIGQAAGMLSNYQDPKKADREQSAWEEAVKAKHGTD
jgi:fructose-specific component phosphotransferase system IIB-like protein